MKKLLYIGNRLSQHGFTPTSIETLGLRLGNHFRVYYASNKLQPWLRLIDMTYKAWRLRKHIDFIIIDTYSTNAFYYAWVIARLARFYAIPYIPILRGGNLSNRLESTPQLSYEIFKFSQYNVAPSGYLKEAFSKKKYNCILIPNYIDIGNYPFLHRKKIQPRFLWVRSFASTYNPSLAVKVLAKLSKEHPNAKLCMVGPDKDGSMIKCQNLAKKLGVYNQIIFTGLQSKSEWIKLSKDYDIFLNTTNFDNTPVSVMEAMALGFPVISTNAGGMPYLFENNIEGVLVNPNDLESMVEAIRILLNNDQKVQSFSLAARKKAEKWDWANVKIAWEKILQRDN